METGYYDMVTTILSAAGIVASTKSMELTADMCGQVDRVVKRIAEVAESHGYSLVIVGTHSEAAHVPEADNERGPCINVPCFIRPCEGVTFERQTCRNGRWMACSALVFTGEYRGYLFEDCGCGKGGAHGTCFGLECLLNKEVIVSLPPHS